MSAEEGGGCVAAQASGSKATLGTSALSYRDCWGGNCAVLDAATEGSRAAVVVSRRDAINPQLFPFFPLRPAKKGRGARDALVTTVHPGLVTTMAVLSLPLSFNNSFWTQDYRRGLDVLYRKLEQVCSAPHTSPMYLISVISGCGREPGNR